MTEEEEKKAIEVLKEEIKSLEKAKIEFSNEIEDKGWLQKNINELDKDIFYKNTLLNLIEKLQKENIKLKQEQAKRSWIHVKENGEVEPLLYISKDKIRKKIEELENGEQCYYEFSTGDLVDLLKILLEEE